MPGPATTRDPSPGVHDKGDDTIDIYTTLTGYLHPTYADSLHRFGAPKRLEGSGGWLLERPVPDTDARDAMGPYPLFVCQNWAGLAADLNALRGALVAVSLVTDPFGDYDRALLEATFDRVAPFKDHLVADLRRPMAEYVSGKYRRMAQRGLRCVTVERCADPAAHVDEFAALYSHLIARHDITGLRAFGRDDLAAQLSVPGAILYRARCREQTVGANLYYTSGRVIYGHLSAFSPLGYQAYASYALWWRALEELTGTADWLDLGAAAGLQDGESGLTHFKRGWATDTRPVYLCGSVLDPERYGQLVRAAGKGETAYFPAYRAGEFG